MSLALNGTRVLARRREINYASPPYDSEVISSKPQPVDNVELQTISVDRGESKEQYSAVLKRFKSPGSFLFPIVGPFPAELTAAD
jgi:hypothetical protein